MKNYKRILAVCLLLSLLVSFCFAPVQVSATEGLIEIATSWGETAKVAPCLIPIILILIGVDWYYSNIDQIVAKADSIYNSASSSLRNWADDVAQQIIDGTSAFKISTVAKNEINKHVESENKKLPDNLPYLIVPPSFRSIDTLSQEDVLIGEISGMVENIQEGVTETNSVLKRIQTYIYDANEQLRKWQVKLNSNITNRLLTINQTIGKMKNALHTTLLRINTSIADMQSSLKTTLLNIEVSLNTIQTSFKTTLLRINENITDTRIALRNEFIPSIQKSLDEILERMPAVNDDVTVKPQIQVQAGTQTITVSDYATMGQAFSAKMAWVPQIFDFLAELRSRLESGSPPKVTLKLSSADGSINWGDQVVVLDMSWYEPYKPLFDNIISGCLWLCFGWALYKRIPDILSGVGLTVENATEPRGNVWSDRAERAESAKYRSDRRADYYRRRGG